MVGSLCSGIGGFEIATEAMGWTTAWVSEVDPYCSAVLAHHFPDAPNLGDLTTVDWRTVERPDILTAGFPCQPASQAGSRLGTADARWLWPDIARAIRDLRPRFVVLENVPGLASVNGGLAMGAVLGDLATLGYDAEWDRLSAGELGAPHKRERIWIVAYAGWGSVERGERPSADGGAAQPSEGGATERERVRADDRPSGGAVGDTTSPRLAPRDSGAGGQVRDGARCAEPERRRGELEHATRHSRRVHEGRRTAGEGAPEPRGRSQSLRNWSDATPVRGYDGTVRAIPAQAAEEGPESTLWPVAARFSGDVARLRSIGNSVVPAWVVEGPFRAVIELDARDAVRARRVG